MSWLNLAQVVCEHKHSGSHVTASVSELQSAELLVHGQDVMVQLSCEQQVLQRSHVLLDGHVMLQDEGKSNMS